MGSNYRSPRRGRERRRRLSRRQKTRIHFLLIAAIAGCIILDLRPLVDWTFLALGVVCELS